jgi:hypothetical protein
MAATEPQPAQAKEVRRGWWRRNWKRLVIGLFLVAILAACGGYYYVFGRIMLSEPFRLAWQEVKQSKQVSDELGGPIHGGWTPHGTIDWNSPIPEANLVFTISGTKTAADVAVLARRIDGVWGFPRFEVTLHGEDNLPGQRINVAAEINKARPPDVPVFDAATQKLASKPKIEQAPAELNIKIDVDPPGDGK